MNYQDYIFFMGDDRVWCYRKTDGDKFWLFKDGSMVRSTEPITLSDWIRTDKELNSSQVREFLGDLAITPEKFTARIQEILKETAEDPEAMGGRLDDLMCETLEQLGYNVEPIKTCERY